MVARGEVRKRGGAPRREPTAASSTLAVAIALSIVNWKIVPRVRDREHDERR